MATPNGSEDTQLRRDTPSPPTRQSGSLQAAATMNAGLQHESSRAASPGGSLPRNVHSLHHARRRSSVLMNLQLNDPTLPGPGELQDSNGSGHPTGSSPQPVPGSPRSPLMFGRDPLQRHGRAPSLGEIHQEFEAETEAHVNRLLQVIQQQQLQLQQLQAQPHGRHSPAAVEDLSASPSATAGTTGPGSGPPSVFPGFTPSSSLPRSPVQPRSSFDLARADLQRRSRTPSRTASPRLRSTSISAESAAADPLVLGGRDESAFYQAETQMLTRENQMLRHRIRDLERQLSELGPTGSAAVATHEPSQHSNLTRSTSISGEDTPATPASGAATQE